jgi:hypothetical protein
MSSKGLCVHFPLVPNDNSYKLGTPDGKHHFALLNCRLSRINRAIDDKKVLALPIYQTNAFKGTSEWVRDIYPLEQFDLNDIDYKPGGNVKRDMLYARQTSEAPIRSFDSGKENARRIQLNICSLHDSGFRIEKYAIQKLRAFWEGDVEGPSLTVNEDWVRDDSQVSIILANDKLEGLAIVLGMSNGHLWVDLLILDTKEVFQDTWHGFWSRKKLLVGRDRISRPFLHGSLNARIENCGGWGSRARLRQVIEVIFDPRGTLRWPVRQTTSFLEFKDTLCVTE